MGKILSRLVQSVDQRVGVKQDHRKGEPAQITTYHKIPKISPGTYIFQRPFLRAYFRRGLYLEGLIYEGNLPFLLCFTLYLEERLNRRFFVL